MKVQNLKGNILINMAILLGVSTMGMSCGVKTNLIPPRPGVPPEETSTEKTSVVKTKIDSNEEGGNSSLEKEFVQKKEPESFLTQ